MPSFQWLKLFSAGHQTFQTCVASPREILSGFNFLRGRGEDVGAVERAARVHGHQLGLRLVPSLHVRGDQSGGSAGSRGHGVDQIQSGYCLWNPLLHRDSPDHRIQYLVGSSVPLQKPRSYRSPAAGPGRV